EEEGQVYDGTRAAQGLHERLAVGLLESPPGPVEVAALEEGTGTSLVEQGAGLGPAHQAPGGAQPSERGLDRRILRDGRVEHVDVDARDAHAHPRLGPASR